MSAKEMQQEFERRIQLISPDLIVDNKPNSDLIFSILNEAQDRYVVINYMGDDQTPDDTNSSARNIDAVRSLLVEKKLISSGNTTMGFTRYRLPYSDNDEYFLYVTSFSTVKGTYKQLTDSVIIANKLIKYKDLDSYATTAYNKPIIRQPAVALMSDPTTKYQYIVLATDKYTVASDLILVYYRKPLRFNTKGGATKCELPESVHSEIVDLAVDIFITEGKYRLQTKPSNKEQ